MLKYECLRNILCISTNETKLNHHALLEVLSKPTGFQVIDLTNQIAVLASSYISSNSYLPIS